VLKYSGYTGDLEVSIPERKAKQNVHVNEIYLHSWENKSVLDWNENIQLPSFTSEPGSYGSFL
jgi:hypothetical protein